MDEKGIWFLEDLNVSGIFCPDKMGHGKHLQRVRNFKKGEYIYLQKEDADKIFFLHHGRIKIGTYSEDGREITKGILEKGEVFGELALFGEDKRKDFAIALENTEVCLLTNVQMKGMMREYKGLQALFMNIVARRLVKMERRLESLVFKDARTRIIDFLREQAEEKGQAVGFEIVIRKPLTHQEMANLTATSRQTVTTVLNELRQEQIISFNRRQILIRDMDRLQ